ncbi:hypothetical protein [Streptomyces sp. Ag109_O5-10]|uniref:hypothetical protein n=1 Tax=Streptomyces sp. Ag109_O5-10 TaxID=1855349 RepID=UPI0008966685|nr:hypothetical protein [Streptomyces sp. Ag109_O5-10]SEE75962.1 hypothetical protein SAMN05216533_3575 [Streptomyces sp. Ag109_O5-10]
MAAADHVMAAGGNRVDTGATGFLGPGQAPVAAGARPAPQGRAVHVGAAPPQRLVRGVRFDCVAVPVEPESEPSELPDVQRVAGRVLGGQVPSVSGNRTLATGNGPITKATAAT